MTPENPSRTAHGTAYLRAAHQILDAAPRILEDPKAVTLLGPNAREQILQHRERYESLPAKLLRSHVVLRSRFTEDRLETAAQRGVAQYVLLGAGLDTFALRQPAWAKSLRIFELDHPSTQAHKRELIAAAGLTTPINTTFVPIDFERDALLDTLTHAGVSTVLPTFFSWLGVTMYLQQSAIASTLRAISSFAPGAEVALTFMPPPDQRSPLAAAAHAALSQKVAGAGEPFVSFFDAAGIVRLLRETGFTQVEILEPAEASQRYFQSRPADLPVPQRATIACAIR